ncbi:MAG: DUF4114 domain-containing protein [Sphingobacteriia bacterium]|nr:MAG: DUF4114 domain-containing protein [Sphingobacteriia bacterium]
MYHRSFKLSCFFLFLFSLSCAKAQYQYLGTYSADGKPNYLVIPGDIVSSGFRNMIATTLPEYRPVTVYNPILLATGRTETINLTCASDIWISFVDEGAGYTNSLGFYTFNTDNPPTTAPPSNQIKIIFPNASKTGFGGGLNTGDKVYLGNFPAKTGIGFVLMTNGWDGSIVNSGNWTLYSTSSFNPESIDSLKKHTVIIRDSITNRFIVGFEDIRRDTPSCDQDFNDLLFFATINPSNCITKLDSIPILSENGDISFSGNTGGLESKSLGNKLAKRVLRKVLDGTNGPIDYTKMEELGNTQQKIKNTSVNGALKLADIMPSSIPEGNYKSFVTTPDDIPGITNAVEVRAVDFTQSNTTKAVAFATKTLDDVYDHTKPICDRLKGAVLLNVDYFTLSGLQFVRYMLKQETGHIEYSMSFSVGKKTGRKSFSFQSNWLNTDFVKEDTLYNYQVWGVAPYLCVDMALDILQKLKNIMPVVQIYPTSSLPTSVIRSGYRTGSTVNLLVKNETSATSAYFEIEERANELAKNKTKRIIPFSLNPNALSNISFPMNDTYESNIAMYVNGKLQDVVYMSDGPWDIAYDSTKTVVQQYQISNDTTRSFSDVYPIFRDVQLKASTENYVTLYKLLRGAGAVQDLSTYKTLNFKAKGNTNLRITLVKNSITNFDAQFKYLIPLNNELTSYTIGFDDFKSNDPTEKINANDLITLLFSFETGINKRTDIEASLADISFSKKSKDFMENLNKGEMHLFPNPATNNRFNASFRSGIATTVTLKVINGTSGQLLYSKIIKAIKGDNIVPIQLDQQIGNALLLISIEGNGIKIPAKKLILKSN